MVGIFGTLKADLSTNDLYSDRNMMDFEIRSVYEEADKKREDIIKKYPDINLFAPTSYNQLQKLYYEMGKKCNELEYELRKLKSSHIR